MADNNASNLLAQSLKDIATAASGPMEAARMNIAQERGNDLATQNVVLQDRQNLTPLEFEAKYGIATNRALGAIDVNRGALDLYSNTSRSPVTQVQDAVSNIGTGAYSMFGGAVTLGSRVLGANVAQSVASTVKDTVDYTHANQSPQMRRSRQLSAISAGLDEVDNERRYQEDVKNDGVFTAELRSLGREATAAVSRMIENPTATQGSLAEGIGSMVAAAPLAGVTSTLSQVGKNVLSKQVTAQVAQKTASHIPLAIGIAEGGSSYSQVANEVLGMSHEELLQNSPEYASLLSQGATQTEAKRQVADTAALRAASIQGPLAAATGNLVARFEAAPLATQTLGSALGNMGRETLEEGVQSFTGQAAQNYGMQAANQEQRLLEGTGSAAAEGAILGLGTAGLIQYPGMATKPITVPAKFALRQYDKFTQGRSKKVTDRLDAAAANSPESLAPVAEEAIQQAPMAAAAVRELAPEAAEYAGRVENAMTIQRDEFKRLGVNMIRKVQEAHPTAPPNRFELVSLMAKQATDPKTAPEDRVSAGLFLADQFESVSRLVDEMPETLRSADVTNPQYQAFNNYLKNITDVMSLRGVKEAIEFATNVDAALDTDITMDEAGQRAIGIVQAQATHAPQLVSPVMADRVLKQDDDGNITLTDQERKELLAAKALNTAGAEYAAATGETLEREEPKTGNLLAPKPSEIVAKQIEEESQGWQLSMADHVIEINRAARSGNPATLTDRMLGLRVFAEGLRNKVEAATRSANLPDTVTGPRRKVTYVSYGPNREALPADSQYTMAIHPQNEGSVSYGRQVEAEANALITLYNNMSEIHGNGERLQPVSFLVPEVAAKPAPEKEAAPAAPTEELDQVIIDELAEREGKIERRKQEQIIKDELIEREGKTERRRQEQVIKDELVEREGKAERRRQEQVIKDELVEREGKAERRKKEQEKESSVQEVTGDVETDTVAPSATAVDVPTEPSPETDKQLELPFDNLVEGSTLLAHFKFSAHTVSRVIGEVSPVSAIKRALRSVTSIQEFMDGKRLTYAVEQANLDALHDVVTGASRSIYSHIRQQMSTEKAAELFQAFAEGTPVNQWVNGRFLNIMEDHNGKLAFNEQLLQSAILAGISHMLTTPSKKRSLDITDVEEITGLDRNQMPEDIVTQFNNGISLNDFKRDMADKIQQYWGVSPSSSADLMETRGLLESISGEIIEAMSRSGWISAEPNTETSQGDMIEFPYRIVDGGGNVTAMTYRLNRVSFSKRAPEVQELINNIGTLSRLVDDVALAAGATMPINFGSPSTEDSRNQLNSGTVNTKHQVEALKNESSTPYLRNETMIGFMKAFGKENFVKLMGGLPFKPGTMNINTEKSLEGKNLSLNSSYDGVFRVLAEQEAHATAAGVAASAFAIFYDHAMSKAGRMQMQGPFNPQSDKFARELIMPTKSILDMTKPEQAALFWMTVAQGIEPKGLKAEKKYRDQIVAAAMAETMEAGGTYTETVSQIADWMKSGEETMPQVLVDNIIAVMDGGTMHGLHGLVSVAKYKNALEAGTEATLEHFNYLEADGKTNGPIMSVLLFANKITAKTIEVLRKGGVFFGEQGRSLNNHITERDGADLYESTTARVAEAIAKFKETIKGNKEAVARMAAVNRVLNFLDGKDISLDEQGNLKLKRGVTKNPLTIMIYGSGVAGIADKVTNSLLDSFYQKVSASMVDSKNNFLSYPDEANGGPRFMDDLNLLVSSGVSRNDGDLKFGFSSQYEFLNLKDKAKLTLTDKQFQALSSNVRAMFVDHLATGIRAEIMDHVSDSTTLLQQATQIQSIFLTGLYKQEMVKALMAKSAVKAGSFLSPKELREIEKRLDKLSPIIKTRYQNYNVGGTQKNELFSAVKVNGKNVRLPDTYATTLSNRYRSGVPLRGPGLAGVKGVPLMVIGNGDGMIMQFLANRMDAVKGTLKVFDGINFAADKMDEGSMQANEAVYQTMLQNPMQAVADSFEQFLMNDPIGSLDPDLDIPGLSFDVRREMTKVIAGQQKVKDSEVLTMEAIAAELPVYMERLRSLALDIEARNIVLSRLSMSVDQMASAESPYSIEGTLEGSTDPTEMAAIIMNETAKVRAELENKKVDPIDRNQNITLGNHGRSDDATGAKVLDITAVRAWANREPTGLAAGQKSLLSVVLTSLKDSGYQVITGTPEQVANYEAVHHPEFITGGDYLGKAVPAIRKVFIKNLSGETLLHELIHAATIQKVSDYYDNNSVLSTEDREAVQRLEGLMGEWVNFNTEVDDTALSDARQMAESQIADALLRGDKAVAVNEFMAWVLSNQTLAKAAKKVNVKNPILRIAAAALDAIRSIIWGKGKAPKLADDMLSNVRFNTRILMKAPVGTTGRARRLALFQSAAFGQDARLANLRLRAAEIVEQYVDEDPEDPIQSGLRGSEVAQQITFAEQKVANYVGAIFNMTPQAESTFNTIYTLLTTAAAVDTNAMTRIQEMYSLVLDKLSVESLMANPNSTNPADYYNAQQKFDVLTGAYAETLDLHGRTDRLPMFLAIALTDDSLRNYLAKLPVPKSEVDQSNTFDAWINNLATGAMDRVARTVSGEQGAKNVRDALDNLANRMATIAQNDEHYVERFTARGIDKVEEIINTSVDALADKVYDTASKVKTNAGNNLTRLSAGMVRLVAGFISNTHRPSIIQGVTDWSNQEEVNTTIRELISEVIGRTGDNAPIFDMISKVRAMVQQTRQQFREQLPNIMAKQFKKVVSVETRRILFRSMGRTDVASVIDVLGVQGTLSVLQDDTLIDQQISNLEAAIQGMSTNSTALLADAKHLAHFMLTGEAKNGLLRNGYAIAKRAGSGRLAATVDASLVNNIEAVTSLYAFRLLDADAKRVTRETITNDANGMEYVMSYLVGLRKTEQSNITSEIARLNAYKGYVPQTNDKGRSLIVAARGDATDLARRGYTEVGPYGGSASEPFTGRRSYFLAPTSGKATYNQGVMQTVHETVNGIHADTGHTAATMAGRIMDPRWVARTKARQAQITSYEREPMLPVFDAAGNVVSYERGMARNVEQALDLNNDLFAMIGVWQGRQVEEQMAKVMNQELVGKLSRIWQEARKTKTTNQFVDISRSNDPIHADAWGMIPTSVRAEIKNQFGTAGFPIRRDMVNDAVGFRSASVGDAWTGQSRLSQAMRDRIVHSATAFLGEDAYTKLIQWEKTFQNFITELKVLIVVKSVVVPFANAVSNAYQLMHRGVPIRSILKGMPEKTTEIQTYVKNRAREIELDADKRAAEALGDHITARRLGLRIQAIQDGNRRMSIWPMIEAGEFSAITEGGISGDDLKLSNFMDKLAEKIPEKAKTPYRYAVLTKDTSLFKGLAMAVQYGDFIAKSIYYDDLTKRQKVSKKSALAQVSEEFVNYNRLAGRVRNYAESMGIVWFWHFKIRSLKIAAQMIRNNPLRSLMMTVAPAAGGIGTPITDNIFTVTAEGRLPNSIGLGTGFRAPALHPWYNLVD